jgi:hypothetical protein
MVSGLKYSIRRHAHFDVARASCAALLRAASKFGTPDVEELHEPPMWRGHSCLQRRDSSRRFFCGRARNVEMNLYAADMNVRATSIALNL